MAESREAAHTQVVVLANNRPCAELTDYYQLFFFCCLARVHIRFLDVQYFPCVHCRKGVIHISKVVSCDNCENWVHIRCCAITTEQCDNFVSSDESLSFVCDSCALPSPMPPCVNFGHSSTEDINQPTKQTTKQPTNQTKNQPINHPTKQLTKQPSNQTTNQPTNQPNNQPINKPTQRYNP